uniref:HIRAN domain-containing protein n=1 Tax=Amphimedon queenslandica TaxID=400682 RepID=A0A1X7T5I6_AMPQE
TIAELHQKKMDCCIRGFHVYQDIWNPVIGEQLSCVREPRNVVDKYAVAIVKSDGTVVGHLPKKISMAMSLFILRGGQITCIVTGKRRYSSDLIQGGLEIPCELSLKSKEKTELTKLLNRLTYLLLKIIACMCTKVL